MMVSKLNPSDYLALFTMSGKFTLLHGEILVNGSLGLGKPLVFFKDEQWNSFIRKDALNPCLKKGLSIFNDKKKFLEYKMSFEKIIDYSNKHIIPTYKKIKNITKENFIQLYIALEKFWYFYGITEWPYHDLAYNIMKKEDSKILKKNLKILAKLKVEGRKVLNEFMFREGTIHNVLKFLSKKYLWEEDDADFLLFSELLSLFDNKKPKKLEIQERKKCYLIGKFNKKTTLLSGEKALSLNHVFTLTKEMDEVNGIAITTGKVKGKVIIALMLNDKKKIKDLFRKMGEGQILVAQSTTPDIMGLCNKASAIVTDQGGMLSHAAIISREMNIPCIIGTEIATKVFKDGDLVEVDADKGIVKKL